MFDSKEYEWSDITLLLGGSDLTGIRSIKYGEKQEKEAVYAKGNKPKTIQRGNRSFEGEFGVLQSELETLRAAGGGSIMGLRLDAVVGYGNPTNGDTLIFDKVLGIEFTEDIKEIKQGDKFMEGKLPFIALDVQNQQ
jgi:hypothetical protein